MKNTRFLIFLLFIAAILVSGCSRDSNESEASLIENKRDELILAIGAEPETGFDPTTGWGRYGSPLFQSTLLKRDHNLAVKKDLAENYEISSDGLVWTVELRDDVVFSDGEALTARDVKFTFETALKNGSILDLTILDSIEVKDDYTVYFHLKKPQSTFIDSLITLGIVPEHAYDETYAENPIGSGPYKLLQWDKGQQIIVEANPYYYNSLPFFQKVTFLFLNEDAAFGAARSGQVDMASIPATFSLQDVPGMRLESINSVDNRGIMFPYKASGQQTEEGHAIGNDVTADLAIRKAINIAVNRQALVEGVLESHGTPAYTIADQLPWWNPDTVIVDNDMELASLILEEDGWEDVNGDGILQKDSLKAEFTLLYPASDSTRQSLAIAVADMIKPLGINIIVEGKSWDEIQSSMHANAVLMGWGSHDPLEMYHVYSGEMMGVEWFNPGYYSNETVDQYFLKALAATSEEEAINYWKKAQWDGKTGFSTKGDSPWAWLVNINHLFLVNEKLDIGQQKIQPHAHGWPITDNIVEWKWKE
ncbi:peptide/nickel transport system substrate-binding protein [Evansella vedderi]|uniref:Peptide/nickel transport system substrate-binding protein n=1 Tax=Evansella vedderi TaxID=38282 RepID=A0ABT9ZZM9_9BACI|nr:ABC transporter substrate-binding protein [Evansella vedderi]MDQ0256696.1 peptide/nickel transport system substrate-binding protein [Evansella vedderi]